MSKTLTFFGSGPVAAKSLELLAKNFRIEAVVTKPQPQHHKVAFPVLEVAERLGITVLNTANKDDLLELFAGNPVRSQIAVVIDYGIIIPESVIQYFPLGIVNSHFSLLPRWRGADPISFAILEGDRETGVSLMLIVEKLDEGPLLAQRSLPISDDATTPSLTDELITLSDQMLTEFLPKHMDGQVEPHPQSSEGVTYSRKLEKKDSLLDPCDSAARLERQVRAFTGWPRSRIKVGDTDIIVTKAHVLEGTGKPGDLWRDSKQFGFYTNQDIFVIDRLIPSGKKEMSVEAFLAGHQI